MHLRNHLSWTRCRRALSATGMMCLLASCIGSAPVRADDLSLARVRDIGHAVVAERARTRHATDTKMKPVMEALSALRQSVRAYAAELRSARDEEAQDPSRRSRSAAAAVPERAEERRRHAEEALTSFGTQLDALIADPSVRATSGPLQSSIAAPSAGTAVAPIGEGQIALHALERLKADTHELLVVPASSRADLRARTTAIDELLSRLEPNTPPPPDTTGPMFRFRGPAGDQTAAEAR